VLRLVQCYTAASEGQCVERILSRAYLSVRGSVSRWFVRHGRVTAMELAKMGQREWLAAVVRGDHDVGQGQAQAWS
jgi:hypothetical protein